MKQKQFQATITEHLEGKPILILEGPLDAAMGAAKGAANWAASTGPVDAVARGASGIANMGRNIAGQFRLGGAKKQIERSAKRIDKEADAANEYLTKTAEKLTNSKNPKVAQSGQKLTANADRIQQAIKQATSQMHNLVASGADADTEEDGSDGSLEQDLKPKTMKTKLGTEYTVSAFDRYMRSQGIIPEELSKNQLSKYSQGFLTMVNNGVNPFKTKIKDNNTIIAILHKLLGDLGGGAITPEEFEQRKRERLAPYVGGAKSIQNSKPEALKQQQNVAGEGQDSEQAQWQNVHNSGGAAPADREAIPPPEPKQVKAAVAQAVPSGPQEVPQEKIAMDVLLDIIDDMARNKVKIDAKVLQTIMQNVVPRVIQATQGTNLKNQNVVNNIKQNVKKATASTVEQIKKQQATVPATPPLPYNVAGTPQAAAPAVPQPAPAPIPKVTQMPPETQLQPSAASAEQNEQSRQAIAPPEPTEQPEQEEQPIPLTTLKPYTKQANLPPVEKKSEARQIAQPNPKMTDFLFPNQEKQAADDKRPPVVDSGEEIQVGSAESPGFSPAEPAPKKKASKAKTAKKAAKKKSK